MACRSFHYMAVLIESACKKRIQSVLFKGRKAYSYPITDGVFYLVEQRTWVPFFAKGVYACSCNRLVASRTRYLHRNLLNYSPTNSKHETYAKVHMIVNLTIWHSFKLVEWTTSKALVASSAFIKVVMCVYEPKQVECKNLCVRAVKVFRVPRAAECVYAVTQNGLIACFASGSKNLVEAILAIGTTIALVESRREWLHALCADKAYMM